MKYNPRDEDSIKAVMAKANVVINLIGMHLLLLIFIFKVKIIGVHLKAIFLCRKGV